MEPLSMLMLSNTCKSGKNRQELARTGKDGKRENNSIHRHRMGWFRNKRKRLEMIQGIKPTSKASLKLQCLFATKGDIDEAKKLYGFFAEDMGSLPDYDPAPVTWVDSTKKTATDIFSWIRDNQQGIATGYEVLRQMTGGRLPPLQLPVQAASAEAAADAAPRPDINA